MTLTLDPPTKTLRRPAWLLVLSLAVAIAFVVVAPSIMPVKNAADLTPVQLADLGAAWVGMHLLWALSVILGCLGLLGLSPQFADRAPLTLAVRVLSVLAAVTMAGYFAVEVTLLGADGPTLAESGGYDLGYLLSLSAFWAAMVATIATAVGLARRGIVRRTGWMVAVLTTLFLVLDVVTYLPALAGGAELADTVGLPPLLLALFWAILGGALFRRVPSGV